jgi:hypothetical protein
MSSGGTPPPVCVLLEDGRSRFELGVGAVLRSPEHGPGRAKGVNR